MRKNINKIIVVLILSVILYNCVSFRSTLFKGDAGVKKARINAITDFVNTYKTPRFYLKKRMGKPFNVFVLTRSEVLNHSIYIISILPEYGKITLHFEDSLGKIPRNYFPNNYIVKDEKLFLWHDSIIPLDKNVLNVMNKYDVLDSIDVKKELGLLPDDFKDERIITFDDRLKGADYFFCKEKIEVYKKIVTNKSLKYYNHPKLKCK